VALRVCAVRLVIGGEKKSQVARRLGITRQTLDSWVSKHRAGGMEALAARRRPRPKSGGGDHGPAPTGSDPAGERAAL
jgi:transposase-like protein